jgi:hypothetical protein
VVPDILKDRRLHHQGQAVLDPDDEGVRTFKISQTQPMTQHHIPEDMHPHGKYLRVP